MVTSASESLTFLSNILMAAFCAHVFHLLILSPTLSSLKATEKGFNGGIPGRMMGPVKDDGTGEGYLSSFDFWIFPPPQSCSSPQGSLTGAWAERALSFPGLCWHSGGPGSPSLN